MGGALVRLCSGSSASEAELRVGGWQPSTSAWGVASAHGVAQARWVAWLESWDVDVRGSCRVRSGAAVCGDAVALAAVRLHGGGAPYSQAQIVGSCGVRAVCERRVTCVPGA